VAHSGADCLAFAGDAAYRGDGADVAELVDARDLKSLGGSSMPVRSRPSAPIGPLYPAPGMFRRENRPIWRRCPVGRKTGCNVSGLGGALTLSLAFAGVGWREVTVSWRGRVAEG
jgi:hypothetical protein